MDILFEHYLYEHYENTDESHQQDLFHLQLSSMIDMNHEPVLLSKRIDWDALKEQLGKNIISTTGNVALPIPLIQNY